MRHRNKTVQIVAFAVLLVSTRCVTSPAQTIDTKLTQTLKIKKFYINRIAANAKNVMRAVRFIHTGLVIRSISWLGGPYTLAGVILGDLIVGLALLIYGQKMTNTFVATKRLGEILQQHPRVTRAMSKKDWKIFNGGKSVFRGPIVNIMHKKAKINNTTKHMVTVVVQTYPELAEKKLKQALTEYFTWTTDIKTYQEARKKRQELSKKKTTPFIKKAVELFDKLITAPSVKKNIERRKNNIQNLLNKTYPALGKLKWFLEYMAETLFQQVKEIRGKHSRKFSLFKRKKS